MGRLFERFHKKENLNIREYIKDRNETIKVVDRFASLIKDNLSILDFIGEHYNNVEVTKKLKEQLSNEIAEYKIAEKEAVKKFRIKYEDKEEGVIFNPSESLQEVLTITEASELWNKDVSTLRRNFAKGTQFKLNIDIRKSGNTWLVTRKSMERVYGTLKKNICVEIRGELEDLGMEYNLEFEWDGSLDDGHFYILDNSSLDDEEFNLVRGKLDKISSDLNNACKDGLIKDIEDLF